MDSEILEDLEDGEREKKTFLRFDKSTSKENKAQAETWGNEIEFLFSCISLSVGLGNVWRFPFIAFQNGGGTFVIPYLIVLLLIGKPVYYLEIILGQFSGRGCIKSFNFSPAMKGKFLENIYVVVLQKIILIKINFLLKA